MNSAQQQGDVVLPWHDHLWQQVVQARTTNRMAHAVLVCGPPGVGKRRFAARLAQALACQAADVAMQPCGACVGCRQWEAGSHPDVSRLEPDADGSVIRVDAMRAFTQRLQLTAQYDTGRLGWIDPAQQLNTAAANSLLKTLEEPPAGTHLLLVADQADRLLPTIRSRCRVLRVPPAPAALARDWLTRQGMDTAGLDDNALRMPLRVLARQNEGGAQLEAGWSEELGKVLCGRGDAVALAQRWAEQPADRLAPWLYRTASALIEYRLTGAGVQDKRLAHYAAQADVTQLEALAQAAARANYLYRTNANWQLVLESVLLVQAPV